MDPETGLTEERSNKISEDMERCAGMVPKDGCVFHKDTIRIEGAKRYVSLESERGGSQECEILADLLFKGDSYIALMPKGTSIIAIYMQEGLPGGSIKLQRAEMTEELSTYFLDGIEF